MTCRPPAVVWTARILLAALAAPAARGADQTLFTPVDQALVDLTPKQASALARIGKSKGTVPGSLRLVRHHPEVVAANAAPFDIAVGAAAPIALSADFIVRDLESPRKSARVRWQHPEKRTEGVHLDVSEKSSTGLIYRSGRVYAVEPIGGGLQTLAEVDMSKFDRDHPLEWTNLEKVPREFPVPAPGSAADAPAGTPPTEIAVLVAYTPKVDELQADVESLIAAAVALANASYENSKINVRLKLVATRKVAYVESGTHEADLAKFRVKGDGVMDEIHDLRDAKKADVCVLLIDNDQFCGLAAAIGADATTAFAVVHHDCAVKNLSFAHEIGHLQGARHNLEVDPTTDANRPFNHGYLSTGTANWRTVMAYPALGKPVRLPFWSNPDVVLEGQAMGTPDKNNNARVLRESAAAISAFR